MPIKYAIQMSGSGLGNINLRILNILITEVV